LGRARDLPARRLHTATLLGSCAEHIGERVVKALTTPPADGWRIEEGAEVPPILHGPVFQLLAGYSIEALLKGILVARDPGAIKEGRLPGWLTKHNLEDLLTHAAITLDAPLLAFVRRMRVAVVWSGRYPVPTSAEAREATVTAADDLEWFEAVWGRLMAELRAAIGQASRSDRRRLRAQEQRRE
jgi:hypothetical protein